MIHIDGSAGEGGGQVLRTALGLSLVTGQPFRITNVRANRKNPGLLAQHLTCVQAAAVIGSAKVTGATLGSRELEVIPGAVQQGRYAFSIGTAGSTTLVVQSVLPALLHAPGPLTVRVTGGTHTRQAPPWEFFHGSLLPVLRLMGAHVEASLEAHGFEPSGGGAIEVRTTPTSLKPMELMTRGALLRRRVTSLVAGIPASAGERELSLFRRLTSWRPEELELRELRARPGNALIAELTYEHVTCVMVSLGRRGTPAEEVARELANSVAQWEASEVPVDEHLADQLIVPLAIAGGGVFRTGPLTLHARTQLELVPRFTGAAVRVEAAGSSVTVAIGRAG